MGTVERVRPATKQEIDTAMERAINAGAYALDAGIDISPRQMADLAGLLTGSHQYRPNEGQP